MPTNFHHGHEASTPQWGAAYERPPSWRDHALCHGNSAPFFNPDRWLEARGICLRCDVRDDCLDDALAEGCLEQFRAGLMPRELADVARVVKRPTRVRACLGCAGTITGRHDWCRNCTAKRKRLERRVGRA